MLNNITLCLGKLSNPLPEPLKDIIYKKVGDIFGTSPVTPNYTVVSILENDDRKLWVILKIDLTALNNGELGVSGTIYGFPGASCLFIQIPP